MPVIVPIIGSAFILFVIALISFCYWGLSRADRRRAEQGWLNSQKKEF